MKYNREVLVVIGLYDEQYHTYSVVGPIPRLHIWAFKGVILPLVLSTPCRVVDCGSFDVLNLMSKILRLTALISVSSFCILVVEGPESI